MKKYYLYRQPILNGTFTNGQKGDWHFDDEFGSYEAAVNQAKHNSKRGSWKVWKIEEVWDFTNEN